MFAKVFSQIFDSSIAQDYTVRHMFMDLLVLADRNGVVDMMHEAIARRTNCPLELVLSTISELEQPDPKSRSPEFSGARIKRLDDHRDWGWMIVNYEYFRKLASEEQRREKTLARVHKHRGIKDCNAVKRTVTQVNACNAMQRHKQIDKEYENKTESESVRFRIPSVEECMSYADEILWPRINVQSWHDHFESNGWKVGGKAPMKNWRAAMRTAKARDKKQSTIKHHTNAI